LPLSNPESDCGKTHALQALPVAGSSKIPEEGEGKAHTCEIACQRQFGLLRPKVIFQAKNYGAPSQSAINGSSA